MTPMLAPPQPIAHSHGRGKLTLTDLRIPGLAKGCALVISQPENGDGPITVRLTLSGKTLSKADMPGNRFSAHEETRLFRRGSDSLLAFRSASGTTDFLNFVWIRASPPRVVPELDPQGNPFEDAPLYHFQRDGRFDDHERLHEPITHSLYTRHWRWSTPKHRFVLTGVSYLRHWDGWGDESLR